MNEMGTDQLEGVNLQVDAAAGRHITEAGKWGKFISIVVFVGCALGLIGVLIGSAYMSTFTRRLLPGFEYASMGAGIVIAAVVIMIGIAVFLYYLLFDFSQKAPMGVATEDAGTLNRGLRSLKLYFLIGSIISILTLLISIYSLINITQL